MFALVKACKGSPSNENCETSALDLYRRYVRGRPYQKKPESDDLRKLFSSGKVCLKYASLSGSAVIDSWKGRPPTKKEKEEQGYQLVESLFLSAFLSQSGQ